MKICFVIGDLIGGGAEKAVTLLSSQLSEMGNDVCVISISNNNESYPISRGVEIIKLPKFNSFFKDFFVRSAKLRHIFKTAKYDVIVPFTTQKNVSVLWASLFTKNKVVICERNDPNNDPHNFVLRMLRKALYWTTEGAVFQTTEAKSFFSKKIQKKSIVIPNAIDVNEFQWYQGIRLNKVVTVGRLEPEKNIIMAIKAFTNASKQYPHFSMEIYGDGSMMETYKKYLLDNHITNIKLMGFQNNVSSKIKDASVFLFPSNYEGISNALLEALALGIPTISTDHPIGGAKLLINDGNTGFLIPVNDLEQMEQKLCMLMENEKLRSSFSRNSAAYIRRHFSLQVIAEKWNDYLKDVIEK